MPGAGTSFPRTREQLINCTALLSGELHTAVEAPWITPVLHLTSGALVAPITPAAGPWAGGKGSEEWSGRGGGVQAGWGGSRQADSFREEALLGAAARYILLVPPDRSCDTQCGG